MSSLHRALFGVVLASALLAAPAAAAIIRVNPAGGACQTTIQAGVNAAGPGDTVKIGPGIYYENVTVPPGKDGLQLVGSSKLLTIIDPDSPNTGPAIRVLSSSGVQIRTLGIRNGQQEGIFLGGNGAVVSGVRIVGLRNLLSVGIIANAGTTGHQILSNEIRSVGDTAIRFTASPGSIVQGNLIAQARAEGISASGDNLQVTSNRVLGALGFGINVTGNALLVAGNQIEDAGAASALRVSGGDPVVRANKLVRSRAATIICSPCAAGLVEGNSSTGSPSFGFSIDAQAPGLIVRSNTVTRARGTAFFVGGQGVQLTQNRVTDSGSYLGDCYVFQGGLGNHTAISNQATRCGASGFLVNAPGVTLDRNVSTFAGFNGFTIKGPGASSAVLTGNTAQSSNAAGFAVVENATGTALSGNLGTKNRYDLCDDGTGTDTSGGNTFGSTSSTCDVTQ